MMLSSLPPFALFFIGAVAVGFTKGLPRKVLCSRSRCWAG